MNLRFLHLKSMDAEALLAKFIFKVYATER